MGIVNPIHLAFLAVVALLVLGPKRFPELTRALGHGMREFKEAMSSVSLTDQPAPIQPNQGVFPVDPDPSAAVAATAVAEPVVAEPGATAVAEPVTSPYTEPVAMQVAEPVATAVAEPVTSPYTEPVATAVAEPVTPPFTEPVAMQVAEAATAVAEPVVTEAHTQHATVAEPLPTASPLALEWSEPEPLD